jgi:hypothetical protein
MRNALCGRRLSGIVGLAAALTFLVTHGVPAAADGPGFRDFQAACSSDNPYLITACYDDVVALRPNPPIVVAFQDPAGGLRPVTLATERQVGSIWGLAFDSRHQAVYAAAYQKRQMPFGPGGPGAIYRIDLATGQVDVLATVPNAGDDHHDGAAPRTRDIRARDWVGRTSLGGIDVDATESELYVVNLADRRIYRFSLPDGRLLGSFAHGASTEPWADEARPFALTSQAGLVFHGVVRTAERSGRLSDMEALVYSSAPDGSQMREVVGFPLAYRRGNLDPDKITQVHMPLDWLPWNDGFWYRSRLADFYPMVLYPAPILADIEFTGSGDMVLGFNDRTLDAGLTGAGPFDYSPLDPLGFEGSEGAATGAGDTILARREGDHWIVDTTTEFFQDRDIMTDEANLGGLAAVPWLHTIVSAATGMERDYGNGKFWSTVRGAKWFSLDTGARTGLEEICSEPIGVG